MNARAALNTAASGVVAVIIALLGPNPAEALCIQPTEQGTWQNADPETRSITRAQIRFNCQDQILNGQPYPPGAPWYIHLWGKCTPSDCDWGEVPAQKLSSGHIYAFYDQGFARRYVYAKMSQYRAGQIWLHIRTDFTDPNRADYESDNWFNRQPAEAASASSLGMLLDQAGRTSTQRVPGASEKIQLKEPR